MMFQYSTYDAVKDGKYDGEITIAELKKEGNFGIGTYNGLEGELIALEGKFFHATNGQVRMATHDAALAWAAVTSFTSKEGFSSKTPLDYFILRENRFKHYVFDRELCAVAVRGRFQTLQIASTPKQFPPYPSIDEVINQSKIFDIKDIEGTLVGFFAPHFMGGIKSPGWHFHFISENKAVGGHVLEFMIHEWSMEIAVMEGFTINFANPSL